MKRKHYDLIVKWAEGVEIEVYNPLIDDYTIVARPMWFDKDHYREHDPYRKLKAENKEVRVIKDEEGNPTEGSWYSSNLWNFTMPADHYESRWKPFEYPYRELEEAAKDPSKMIRLINNGRYGSTESDWFSCAPWKWEYPPECYEIRDKTKKKLYQWICQDKETDEYFTTSSFYPLEGTEELSYAKLIKPALWTEIEVYYE